MEQDRRRESVAIAVSHERQVAAYQQRQTVLWIIAILLAIIAVTLLLRSERPFAVQPAFGDTPMVGARGVFAFTGQLDKNSTGLWMMDVDSGNVWCYQYLPATRRLKLVAARSFLYDRHLTNYNCDDPPPDEVRIMLDDERRIQERNARGGTAPDEEGALGTNVPGFPLPTGDSTQSEGE